MMEKIEKENAGNFGNYRGEFQKAISSNLSNDSRVQEFHKNKSAQSDLETFGAACGNDFYVSDIGNNPRERADKVKQAKEHFKEIMLKNDSELSTTDLSIKNAFVAFKKGELAQYCMDNIQNNSDDPTSLGGTAYFMPTLAKMIGETYVLETSLGTVTSVNGSKKHFLVDDYLTAKTNTSFEYAQYVAYLVESKPTIFRSYADIKNCLTQQPGSQAPLNVLNNYDYEQEARSVKTYSFSMTVQYNEMQVKQLQGWQGINQIAWKQQMAQRTFDEVYYYNGVYDLFNNSAFTEETAKRNTAAVLPSTDLIVQAGMVDSTGALIMNFSDVADKAFTGSNNGAIMQFINAFKTYKESRYGNNTMKTPVLVLPLVVFNKWATTPLTNSASLGVLAGYNNFLTFFENNTGIEVMALNLLDPQFATAFDGLSLSLADVEQAFFYDKSQFHYITTKNFAQYNTWGTANNVDFTTIYEGQFCSVFNPYYNPNVAEQNIPAIHFVLKEAGATNAKNLVKEAEVEVKKTATKAK